MFSKIKRAYIQFLSTIFFNLPFLSVYLKYMPMPVLHCYACPLATGACPIGTIQYFITIGMIPFFVIGILGIFGLLLGRFFCGFLCPFGFIQDLFFKVSKREVGVPYWVSYSKYGVLIIFVVLLPFFSHEPVFCKFCPAGTLEAGIPIIGKEYIKKINREENDSKVEKLNFNSDSLKNQSKTDSSKKLKKVSFLSDKDIFNYSPILSMIGILFFFKIIILLLTLIISIFIKRPFCKICPLGAIFSFFNKINIFNNLKIKKSLCTECTACEKSCPSGIQPIEKLNSIECIKCNECKDIGCGAIE